MDTKNWIIKWFIKNSDVSEFEINNYLNEDYFLKGWIDSLQFISFINDIETTFDITFSNDEFQDRTFSSIEGICKIIDDKIAKKI